MKKFLEIAAMAACVTVGLVTAQSALAEQVTITSYGGAYQAAARKAYFEPYAKQTGVKLIEDEYTGEFAKVRAMVDSKSVSWDVVETDSGTALELCDQGIIEKIDWKKLGLDRAQFINGQVNDCAVPNLVATTVLGYDKDKLPNGPKTVADLFDTQKFPGKRGLSRSAWGNLEWALIADGVAIKDVYKVLDTPAGIDRAFSKLDSIKKNVIWYATNAQPPQLLADGQVIMASAPNGRFIDANKNAGKHFEFIWAAGLAAPTVWIIPRGTPRVDAAYKFIAFAAAPQPQADLTRYIPYGPANLNAIAHVDAATRPDLPTTPENIGVALQVDAQFWANKGAELRSRFFAWLAK